MKTAIAFIAVVLVSACSSMTTDPAGSASAPVKSETDNVVDSQGAQVITDKY